MAATAYGGSTNKGNISSILSVQHALDTIKKPQVIVRLVVLVLCIILFGTIADNGGDSQTCFINEDFSNKGPCILGLFVGVMGFLVCLGFLVIDFLFELSNNMLVRKWFVIADIGVSALWSFFSLIAFAVMTDSWRKNGGTYASKIVNGIRAAIAFSFFAIFGFGALAGLAVYRLRLGAGSLAQGTSAIPGGTTGTPQVEPTSVVAAETAE